MEETGKLAAKGLEISRLFNICYLNRKTFNARREQTSPNFRGLNGGVPLNCLATGWWGLAALLPGEGKRLPWLSWDPSTSLKN